MEVKKLPAAFYCTASGNEPVREWLQSLETADRRIIGQDIATAEFGWPVGMPVCRSLARPVRDTQRSDQPPHRPRDFLRCGWAHGASARVYQEDAENAEG
jgi:hypothetical protein